MPQNVILTAWAVDGNHVYPLNDLRPHTLFVCCCKPFEDDGVIVHNSMDRREVYERKERLPS